MKKPIGIAFALFLAPAAASAEIWTVAEGLQAKVRGTWNVTVADGNVTGNATMSGADGRPLTYAVNGMQKDGNYVFQRINSSDRSACTYVGKPQGDTISGSAMCNGANTPWLVTKGK